MSKFFLNLIIALLLSAVGAGAGWFMSNSMLPAQWKATAQFEQPKVVDLGNYYALYSTYTLVKSDKPATELDKEMSDNSYSEFKRTVTLPNIINSFLVQTDVVKSTAKVESKAVDEIAQRFADGFVFQNDSNTLSITTNNPDHSVELLNQFIAFSTLQARTTLNNELIAKWKILFQQVKQSAEQKLGESWEGKLNIMKSVQPLDNGLVPYRVVKQPTKPLNAEKSENQLLWIGIGAGIGFILSLLIMGLIALATRKPKEN
ncbi:hypothetical protein A1D22_10290 [Pasteurellaceae bacterium LFhippo2]|nr:hypothetical protein [Pasteurellaceae bacterium LFhippo2]